MKDLKPDMQEGMANIFICQTPFQNFFAKQIAEQFYHTGIKNYIFSTKGDWWTNENTSFFSIRKNSAIGQFIDLAKAKNRIGNILLNHSKTNIFISHTGSILGAHLSSAWIRKNKNVKINFYFEGVLYFIEYSQKMQVWVHFYRKIVSLILGLNYNFQAEILPIKSEWVNKIYTPYPQMTQGPKEKMVKVEIKPQAFRSQEDVVLVLGGWPPNLSEDEIMRLYSLILENILTIESQPKVLFKPHHADKSRIFHQIAKKVNIGFETITSFKPVETIITGIKPSKIYSCPGSSIVNIQQMFGDQIDLHTYYPLDKKSVFRTRIVYEKLNIEIAYY